MTLPSDAVLELGCSFGDTTVELAARARHVSAVDNSDLCVTKTIERVAGLPAHVDTMMLDVIGNGPQVCSAGAGCSSIFCDIGGVRALSVSYIDLIVLLLQELRPSLLVIKCRQLHLAAVRAMGSCDGGGILPMSSAQFWSELRAAAVEDASTMSTEAASTCEAPSADDGLEVEAWRVPADEKRICYTFLNTGACARRGGRLCTFRHLRPEHPEALADAQKRAAVGWHPSRLRGASGSGVSACVSRLEGDPACGSEGDHVIRVQGAA